jgi:DNA-binding GntR family transcriptional regulator
MNKGRISSRHENRTSRSSDRILSRLREMILTMEIPPGSVMTEESLCKLLECTRAPLREALLRLDDEHLIMAVPHRGVSITDLSILDFAEIIEAHECVERMVVRRAATRITDDQIAEIERLITEAKEASAADDTARVVELDYQTHAVLGAASSNRYLKECQVRLHRLLQRYVYLGFERVGAAGAISDHQRILDALRDHDPDLAEEVLSDHVHNGRDRMRSAL